jgi:antitoxin YefM
MVETTYSQARANLKKLLDEVVENREPVVIRRRAGGDVALIAADELRGILETLYLLRSPNNAKRLMTALKRAKSRKLKPRSVGDLRRELDATE